MHKEKKMTSDLSGVSIELLTEKILERFMEYFYGRDEASELSFEGPDLIREGIARAVEIAAEKESREG